MIWLLGYAAIACLVWGLFIGADRDAENPTTNFVMALIWPVALLMVAGYCLGSAAERDQ